MVIDSRNSSILPKRGALLKINQVALNHLCYYWVLSVCLNKLIYLTDVHVKTV